MKFFIASLVALLAISSCPTIARARSPCFPYQDHPLYRRGIKPVLISCWTLVKSKKTPYVMYNVAHRDHSFAPIDNLSSKIYDGLDWFYASNGRDRHDKFMRIHFTRKARVYLVVPSHRAHPMRRPNLRGWKSLGRAKIVRGKGKPFRYGVHQKRDVIPKMYDEVYVFSRTGKNVIIPHRQWIGRAINARLQNGYRYFIWVAEANGSRPRYPPQPRIVRQRIRPQQTCPKDLHNVWKTRNTDNSDRDTRGRMWQTSHPMWDPIFWCAYDHEHGSMTKQLMDYEPKYGYTAWKNNREQESNEGFKNFVIQTRTLNVLFMMHAQTSSLRRIDEVRHSILVVVKDRRTNELLAEITHKGYYGFLGVRKAKVNGIFMALSKKDAQLQKKHFKSPRRRSINILNRRKLDKRFLYRFPRHTLMLGVYEDWTTGPICAPKSRKGIFRIDFTKSATGVPSFGRRHQKVDLGEYDRGIFYRSTGVARIVILRNFEFGDRFCNEDFPNRSKSGVFYTNSWGTKLERGPGRNAMRQYVKPGFHMRLNGEFKAADSFTGVFRTGVYNEMKDYGYGLNPDRN